MRLEVKGFACSVPWRPVQSRYFRKLRQENQDGEKLRVFPRGTSTIMANIRGPWQQTNETQESGYVFTIARDKETLEKNWAMVLFLCLQHLVLCKDRRDGFC